ncbi:MAG TPA: hypothetical protein VEZ12_22350 [Herpetosiphonaceae bacterium]|nr:hypothetical protein [Herpetosiphonaceae bacterium]
MTAPATSTRRPLLHGWRGLVILFALALGGALLAIGYWLTSDADLRRVERDMASAGLPTTLASAGVLVDMEDPESERLFALGRALKPWAGARVTRLQPGVATPEELRAWRMALPDSTLAAMAALIDGRPPGPVAPPRPGKERATWFLPWYNLIQVIGQCMAIAPDAEVPSFARRLVRLMNLAPDNIGQDGGLAQAALVHAALAHLVLRLPELKRDADLAGDLLAMARRFDAESEQRATRYLIDLLSWFRRFDEISDLRQRTGTRLVREQALRLQLTWILRSRTCTSALERHALAKKLTGDATAKPPTPRLNLGFEPWWAMVTDPASVDSLFSNASIRLRLLAAEIMGDPWPIDPYSRTGDPLRRIERDGVLIGGYSIGPDERDAGGGKGDLAVALYGPLKPQATAPSATP